MGSRHRSRHMDIKLGLSSRVQLAQEAPAAPNPPDGQGRLKTGENSPDNMPHG